MRRNVRWPSLASAAAASTMADWNKLPRAYPEPAAKPPKRRRKLRIYLPHSYSVQRFLVILLIGSGPFGAVLGDIWLWMLLYGLIWSCPDCGKDLVPTEHGSFWCPCCDHYMSAAYLTTGDLYGGD